MRDKRLRAFGELLLVEVADVIAGGEHLLVAGDDQTTCLEAFDGLRKRVEDLVIERTALGRVRDPQPRDMLGRLVEEELPRREFSPRRRQLLENDEGVALRDRLTFLAADLLDGAG